jgi:hypothetical protein
MTDGIHINNHYQQQHPPGGTLKLAPSTRSRSPKAFTSPSTSNTLPPRRGPTGMVMESTVLLRTKLEAWGV